MLELEIVKYIVACEGGSSLVRGRLMGYQISWMQKEFKIPRGTFYRAINQCIKSGFIVRSGRGLYCLTPKFRSMCNHVPDSKFVSQPKAV